MVCSLIRRQFSRFGTFRPTWQVCGFSPFLAWSTGEVESRIARGLVLCRRHAWCGAAAGRRGQVLDEGLTPPQVCGLVAEGGGFLGAEAPGESDGATKAWIAQDLRGVETHTVVV